MKFVKSILSWSLFSVMFVMTLYIVDFASSTYALQDLLLAFAWFGVVSLVITLFLVGDSK
jgi:hypothetical protein